MSRRRLASRGGAFRRFFRSGGARIVFLGSPRNAPVELRITPVFKAFFAVVALVGLTLGGHYAWLVLRAGPGARELLEERSSLRELNRGYARDTERMAARIEDLEVQMRRLAVLAGAEPVAPRMAGLGGGANGASGYDYVARRLEDLSGRMAALDRQGVALERVMRDKSRLMASTPSIWPVRGYLSSGYGSRADPFTGEIAPHYGIDISADTGTPVRVTADGVVIDVGNSSTFGRFVVVSHGFGRVTRYAHLSRTLVRRSQRLLRGAHVGEVGNTGRSRSPHLHYEVWVDERSQNPLDFIVDYSR